MTTSKRKLTFRIEGDGVAPETVRLKDLYEILSLVEQTFASTAKGAGAKNSDDLSISLVEIRDGSERTTLAMSESMYAAANQVSESIANDQFESIPVQAQAGLRKLWNRAKKSDWTFEFLPSDNGLTSSSITPDHEILRPGEVSGRTTLYGRCDRVGGAKVPTAWLTLISGETFVVALKDKQLAKKLGDRLYEIVGLEGEATWDLDDWKLNKFRAININEYQDTDIVSAFENLAAQSGNYWDEIDPNEYVAELRAD